MRFFGFPWFLPLLATGFWFVAGGVGKAQEVKFPEKAPLVSFTLPANWFVDEDGNSDASVLDCVRSATIKFRLRLLKDKYGDADFQQQMASFVKANLGTFGLDASSLDPAAIKVTSRALNDKIKAVCAEVKLKSLVLDEPCRLRIIGFTVDGKSMLAMCSMEESAQKAAQDLDKILGSLKPTK